MKSKMIDVNNAEIEPGWEWFVFKKRSQRNRKARFNEKRRSARMEAASTSIIPLFELGIEIAQLPQQ